MMTINPIRIATISLAVALALSTNVRADDGGLYEKPLDPNSAFVRVIAPGATSAARPAATSKARAVWRRRGGAKGIMRLSS